MRVLDLFSGIGGFSLGLERAGMQTVAFCEIEPFCRRVLAKHWPEVPIYDDVRTLTAARLAADGIVFDLICGGFPCQDLSVAGKGAGLSGERSGLWFQFQRLIEETSPGWVIVENVPALRTRGLDQVLGGLFALGYDAEWRNISAAGVGARHLRNRLWLVAYPNGSRQHEQACSGDEGGLGVAIGGGDVADAMCIGPQGLEPIGSPPAMRRRPADKGDAGGMADAGGAGLPLSQRKILCGTGWREEGRAAAECSGRPAQSAMGGMAARLSFGMDGGGLIPPPSAAMWASEPDIPRLAKGVPNRRARLEGLGNAVVPQIPELIGRAIMARAQQEQSA